MRRPVASDRDPRVGAPAPARGMIACAAGSRLGAMADVPDRLEPSELRASDADRERVAEVLRQAAAEGRLDLNELDERLGLVYAARTYADLAPLTRDLPTGDVTPLPVP